MARSRGVAIYGTYALIIGWLNLAGNVALVLYLTKRGVTAPVGMGRAWLGAGVSALLIAAGIGAFRLKPWGRTLAMLAALATLGLTLLNVPHIQAAGTPAQRIGFISGYIVFPVLLNGGLLWFFTRPTVAAQFRRP